MTDLPCAVWGCDPSTKRIALAAADGRGVEHVAHVDTPKGINGGERLGWLYDAARQLADRFCRMSLHPLYVFVEQPSGRFVKPELSYAAGVIQAGLYNTLAGRYKFPVTVRTVTPRMWKVYAVGSGSASKAQVLARARDDGYEGSVQDEADAWCIARVGWTLLYPGDPDRPEDDPESHL